jgi:hypothetical protein
MAKPYSNDLRARVVEAIEEAAGRALRARTELPRFFSRCSRKVRISDAS